MQTFPEDWDLITKIDHLQRKIILNSILYYEYNMSNISDFYYDNMCRQLGMSQGVDLIHGSSAFYPRLPAQQTYQMMGH